MLGTYNGDLFEDVYYFIVDKTTNFINTKSVQLMVIDFEIESGRHDYESTS